MTTATFNRLHDSDEVPSLSRFVAYKIGVLLDRKDKQSKYRARTRIQSIIRLLLHIAGFACLTIAGFTWDPAAGFIVAGLSCFAFSLLTTTGESDPTMVDGSPMRR